MEPTLHGCANCNDDHILIDKISYRFHPPQQSDIVVFAAPPGAGLPDKVLVKRVVGLPGQHLALRHGYVYINGKRLEEPYLNRAFLRKECGPGGPSTPETGRSRWTIPSGDVFVMGDNRCNSTDSRAFGPIPDSSIIGRAFAIIWPLGRIRLL
jgi:signal peptidase I